jgi:hypothetical protein
MRKLKHLLDVVMRRSTGELSPRDQARLRLASELGQRKAPPQYQAPVPVPWYDRALERLRREGG